MRIAPDLRRELLGEALAGGKVREREDERDEGGFVSKSRSSPELCTLYCPGGSLLRLFTRLPSFPLLFAIASPLACSFLRLLSIQEIIARSRALGNRSCGSFTDCAVIGSEVALTFIANRGRGPSFV